MEPPTRLVLSWQIAPGFAPEPDGARASRVDVHFDADGPERTVVTLVHSAFERHGDGWQALRDGVAGDGGWPGIMTAYREVATVS